eukprot:TRINITY_DN25459_c0_g1_i1.p1 TRINITY_DN25459_c0_g1~~TRINITY_DN25459_c0_g1_i1.p1  ORF type:complete len:114 (-),score=16.90 TRINITY_DN25459_c0_g1_i1:17-358(-)
MQNFIMNQSNLKRTNQLIQDQSPNLNSSSKRFFLADKGNYFTFDKATIKQQVLNIQKKKESKIYECLKFFQKCLQLQQLFIARVFKKSKKQTIQVSHKKISFSKAINQINEQK